MKLTSRQLAGTVAILLLGASGYAYFRNQGRDGAERYVTEPVSRGPVASTVTATGTINPVKTVQVGTYVSGPIQAIYVDYNSLVKKDQLVAKIDPRPFTVKVMSADAAVANAKAKVAKARADLAFKKLAFERNRQLLERKLIAQSDFDTAKSQYDQARAQLDLDEAGVKQAAADLEAARISLAYTDITSPVDGVVVSRNVDVGQTVAASFQTPTLFLIAQDLTKMQVDTNVSESDIGGVETAQDVTFRVDAYPDKDFHGKVVQVRNAPITVQNVVTYDVVIAVDNPDLELRPGMTTTVTITTAKVDDVLRVPVRALRFRPQSEAGARPGADGPASPRKPGRNPTLWVLDGEAGRDGLRPVKIQTGIQNDAYAELKDGDLREKDLVVVGYERPEQASGSAPKAPPSFMGGGHRRYR